MVNDCHAPTLKLAYTGCTKSNGPSNWCMTLLFYWHEPLGQTRGPDASPTGLVSSSRSRLRTHLDVAQRSNCPSKIKNQFGYHAQDRRARREGRRRNEVPIDSGAPPSALQPATTRRSNSVGRWPRSGAGAEAENTRSCQGAGRFWNEDRLPPAEPGR